MIIFALYYDKNKRKYFYKDIQIILFIFYIKSLIININILLLNIKLNFHI